MRVIHDERKGGSARQGRKLSIRLLVVEAVPKVHLS